MFTILALLTAILSIMFVVSVTSTLVALRREGESAKRINKHRNIS